MRFTILSALFLCFFLPWLAASFYIKQYASGTHPAPDIKLATILQPGTKILHPEKNNNIWTLILFQPPSTSRQQRYVLWQEQSALFPQFLKNKNLCIQNVDSKTPSLDFDTAFQSQISWDWEENAGAVLVDPRGFGALVFNYDKSPKESFFNIKKLASS